MRRLRQGRDPARGLFEQPIKEATVVTLYLLPALNIKLIPKLQKRNSSRARAIVSQSFDMKPWNPTSSRG